MRRAASILLLQLLPAPALAQQASDDSLGRAVDRVFAEYSAPGSPGCAMGVYENGRIRLERGYGLANLEYGAPITPRTPFIVGSVSKQFTAASIALLVQDGRLSLDDDVRKYVPELPAYDRPITIRELVHHTSGLRDFWELVAASGRRMDDGYTTADMLRLASRQKALNFTPGDRYLYSNTGYLVLALVVQRASGQSLPRYAAEHIFAPLGMTGSHFHDDHTALVPGRARSYSRDGSAWRLADWNNDLVGQGGLMTTVEDLARWDENFYTGRVGGPAFLARQLERGVLNDGSMLSYAFGLEIGEYRGQPIVEHGGATGGYRAEILRFPRVHTSVVALCNVASAEPAAMARRVADVVLAPKLGPPAPLPARQAGGTATEAPKALTAAEQARFVGQYYSAELDATYVIEQKEGGLALRIGDQAPRAVTAVDARTLRVPGALLHFGDDATSGFTLEAGRIQGISFQRVGRG